MSAKAVKLDLLIIGAGPAGLSAAQAAAQEGLEYRVVEKELIAHTIYEYPVGRTVFSTPNELEIEEGALKPIQEKPTREELLSHYVGFALRHDLRIQTEEEALSIERSASGRLRVPTSRGEYDTATVLVAFGAMAIRRRLKVPGEELPKVSHRFIEPYPYVNKEVLVVGGGNSAAEAALFLCEEGAHTSFALWRSDWENRDPKMGGIKHWVRAPLESHIDAGRLRLVFFKEILRIAEHEVELVQEDGSTLRLANAAVFVLIGTDADLTLLRNMGVGIIESGFNHLPVYDPETFETEVPGLYVAGHFTNARHIQQAIAVPRRIIPLIAKRLRANK